MVVRAVFRRALAVAALCAVTVPVGVLLATPATAHPPAGGRALAGAPAAPEHPAAVGLLPVPARAEGAPARPRRPVPTAVLITGDVPQGRITVTARDNPEVFQALVGQVSWLAGAVPQTTVPKPSTLGPKFTLTVLVGTRAQHTYDMYPLATGGPRAYRPAKQPIGKVAAGWFYGRLTMSETLRVSGVPLPEKPDLVSGGIGGGERVDVIEELDPAGGLSRFLGEMRQLFLLNGAVVLTIALGLAGISYLIRRRV